MYKSKSKAQKRSKAQSRSQDPINDPLTQAIAYANPKYRKYSWMESVILILLIVIGIPFLFAYPVIGIVIIAILALLFILVFRRGVRFLSSTAEEISAAHNTAPWWNERNKAYRKYTRQTSRKQAIKKHFSK